ncbi:MAG: hypothetical protein LBF54_04145 [Holosporaceae bacterium]|nr:hypothetical protein [Holosporaceae bacterium]
MAEDKSQIKGNSGEPVRCCKKSKCVAATLVVLIVGAFLFYHYSKAIIRNAIDAVVSSRLSQERGSVDDQIIHLKNEISHLKKRVELESGDEKKSSSDVSQLRGRWKTWLALRSKMETGEPFEEELGKFNKLFSCDNELIGLVKDLVSSMKVATDENRDGIINVCKSMIKKITACKKNDGVNLEKISGYVLSSCDCDRE